MFVSRLGGAAASNDLPESLAFRGIRGDRKVDDPTPFFKAGGGTWSRPIPMIQARPRFGNESLEVEWDVAVERASTTDLTYSITVRNLSSLSIDMPVRRRA
jgi:hypothetical protein